MANLTVLYVLKKHELFINNLPREYQGVLGMREKVQAAIDKIRPALQKDGGDVILVDVTEEGIVKVQLTGACKGCPMSQMTLKEGIEKFVKSEIPEIVSVESV